MGTFCIYSCDNCVKEFELGGPQEFKKTLFGIKELPHPAVKKKIGGLLLYLWCPKCRKVFFNFVEVQL